MQNNIVFLYTRMAGYFFHCIEHFVDNYPYQAHIIHRSPSEDAPYQWKEKNGIHFYDREKMTSDDIVEILKKLQPKAVYVVNWADKAYIWALFKYKRRYKPELTVIAGFDNPWRGNIKQYAGQLIARFMVRKIFTFAWVTGIEQYEFARKMGFQSEYIVLGLYSANVDAFQNEFTYNLPLKEMNYPRVLLYAGRLIDWKGIEELYEVFGSLTEEERNGWTLKIIGEGNLKDKLYETESIQISDFVQPKELPKVAGQVGAFSLPSWDEHWGVVMHEFAAAGLPLISSDKVSSATNFLIPGYNGFQFKAGNKKDLKDALIELFRANNEQLLDMGKHSFGLSNRIRPEQWIQNLANMIGATAECSDTV